MAANLDQLVFELPHRAAQGIEDFFVGSTNAAAVEWIDRWPDWPAPAAALIGDEGAGKTHLAQVWMRRSGGALVEARAISEADAATLHRRRALVVDNLDRGLADERALFHLLNLAREENLSMLLTSRQPPGTLEIALPDLRSRLRALPAIHIEPPDERLIKVVLVKLLADRQLVVEPHVLSYLALNLERSMAAVARLVALLDGMSLALQRRVSRRLAADAIEEMKRSR